MRVGNLFFAVESLAECWSPKIVAQANDQYLKVAKVKGQFVWHKHDAEDELFLVIRGRLVIQLDGADAVHLEVGDFFVVPRGVRHCPFAEDECWIALIEPTTTRHSGDTVTPMAKTIEQQL